MREIKFRAWNKEINKMWSYEVMRRNTVFGLSSGLRAEDFLLIPTNEKHILMQYTGLKDKNGVKIYEGDYIYGAHPDAGIFRGVVEWDNEQSMYILKDTNVEAPFRELDEIEIFGNIYENNKEDA
jgi:uncharacterized phage protein (TIGR01671 family)